MFLKGTLPLLLVTCLVAAVSPLHSSIASGLGDVIQLFIKAKQDLVRTVADKVKSAFAAIKAQNFCRKLDQFCSRNDQFPHVFVPVAPAPSVEEQSIAFGYLNTALHTKKVVPFTVNGRNDCPSTQSSQILWSSFCWAANTLDPQDYPAEDKGIMPLSLNPTKPFYCELCCLFLNKDKICNAQDKSLCCDNGDSAFFE